MKVLHPTPISALALALLAPLASVEAVTIFQDGVNGYTGTADTNIFDSMATKNFGGNDQMYTRYNSNSSGSAGYDMAREGRNVLLRFDDLDAELSGQTVTSASITLTFSTVAVGGGGDANAVLFAYELLKPWNEGSGTGSSGTTGTASWNDSVDATPWQAAGAKGSEDRNLTPIFTTSEFNIGGEGRIVVGDTIVLELDTDLVQSWIDSPSENYGLLISVATENQYRYPVLGFYSSEYGTVSDRPVLSVTTIPEPAQFGTLAAVLALLVLVRNRRK